MQRFRSGGLTVNIKSPIYNSSVTIISCKTHILSNFDSHNPIICRIPRDDNTFDPTIQQCSDESNESAHFIKDSEHAVAVLQRGRPTCSTIIHNHTSITSATVTFIPTGRSQLFKPSAVLFGPANAVSRSPSSVDSNSVASKKKKKTKDESRECQDKSSKNKSKCSSRQYPTDRKKDDESGRCLTTFPKPSPPLRDSQRSKEVSSSSNRNAEKVNFKGGNYRNSKNKSSKYPHSHSFSDINSSSVTEAVATSINISGTNKYSVVSIIPQAGLPESENTNFTDRAHIIPESNIDRNISKVSRFRRCSKDGDAGDVNRASFSLNSSVNVGDSSLKVVDITQTKLTSEPPQESHSVIRSEDDIPVINTRFNEPPQPQTQHLIQSINAQLDSIYAIRIRTDASKVDLSDPFPISLLLRFAGEMRMIYRNLRRIEVAEHFFQEMSRFFVNEVIPRIQIDNTLSSICPGSSSAEKIAVGLNKSASNSPVDCQAGRSTKEDDDELAIIKTITKDMNSIDLNWQNDGRPSSSTPSLIPKVDHRDSHSCHERKDHTTTNFGRRSAIGVNKQYEVHALKYPLVHDSAWSPSYQKKDITNARKLKTATDVHLPQLATWVPLSLMERAQQLSSSSNENGDPVDEINIRRVIEEKGSFGSFEEYIVALDASNKVRELFEGKSLSGGCPTTIDISKLLNHVAFFFKVWQDATRVQEAMRALNLTFSSGVPNHSLKKLGDDEDMKALYTSAYKAAPIAVSLVPHTKPSNVPDQCILSDPAEWGEYSTTYGYEESFVEPSYNIKMSGSQCQMNFMVRSCLPDELPSSSISVAQSKLRAMVESGDISALDATFEIGPLGFPVPRSQSPISSRSGAGDDSDSQNAYKRNLSALETHRQELHENYLCQAAVSIPHHNAAVGLLWANLITKYLSIQYYRMDIVSISLTLLSFSSLTCCGPKSGRFPRVKIPHLHRVYIPRICFPLSQLNWNVHISMKKNGGRMPSPLEKNLRDTTRLEVSALATASLKLLKMVPEEQQQLTNSRENEIRLQPEAYSKELSRIQSIPTWVSKSFRSRSPFLGIAIWTKQMLSLKQEELAFHSPRDLIPIFNLLDHFSILDAMFFRTLFGSNMAEMLTATSVVPRMSGNTAMYNCPRKILSALSKRAIFDIFAKSLTSQWVNHIAEEVSNYSGSTGRFMLIGGEDAARVRWLPLMPRKDISKVTLIDYFTPLLWVSLASIAKDMYTACYSDIVRLPVSVSQIQAGVTSVSSADTYAGPSVNLSSTPRETVPSSTNECPRHHPVFLSNDEISAYVDAVCRRVGAITLLAGYLLGSSGLEARIGFHEYDRHLNTLCEWMSAAFTTLAVCRKLIRIGDGVSAALLRRAEDRRLGQNDMSSSEHNTTEQPQLSTILALYPLTQLSDRQGSLYETILTIHKQVYYLCMIKEPLSQHAAGSQRRFGTFQTSLSLRSLLISSDAMKKASNEKSKEGEGGSSLSSVASLDRCIMGLCNIIPNPQELVKGCDIVTNNGSARGDASQPYMSDNDESLDRESECPSGGVIINGSLNDELKAPLPTQSDTTAATQEDMEADISESHTLLTTKDNVDTDTSAVNSSIAKDIDESTIATDIIASNSDEVNFISEYGNNVVKESVGDEKTAPTTASSPISLKSLYELCCRASKNILGTGLGSFDAPIKKVSSPPDISPDLCGKGISAVTRRLCEPKHGSVTISNPSDLHAALVCLHVLSIHHANGIGLVKSLISHTAPDEGEERTKAHERRAVVKAQLDNLKFSIPFEGLCAAFSMKLLTASELGEELARRLREDHCGDVHEDKDGTYLKTSIFAAVHSFLVKEILPLIPLTTTEETKPPNSSLPFRSSLLWNWNQMIDVLSRASFELRKSDEQVGSAGGYSNSSRPLSSPSAKEASPHRCVTELLLELIIIRSRYETLCSLRDDILQHSTALTSHKMKERISSSKDSNDNNSEVDLVYSVSFESLQNQLDNAVFDSPFYFGTCPGYRPDRQLVGSGGYVMTHCVAGYSFAGWFDQRDEYVTAQQKLFSLEGRESTEKTHQFGNSNFSGSSDLQQVCETILRRIPSKIDIARQCVGIERTNTLLLALSSSSSLRTEVISLLQKYEKDKCVTAEDVPEMMKGHNVTNETNGEKYRGDYAEEDNKDEEAEEGSMSKTNNATSTTGADSSARDSAEDEDGSDGSIVSPRLESILSSCVNGCNTISDNDNINSVLLVKLTHSSVALSLSRTAVMSWKALQNGSDRLLFWVASIGKSLNNRWDECFIPGKDSRIPGKVKSLEQLANGAVEASSQKSSSLAVFKRVSHSLSLLSSQGAGINVGISLVSVANKLHNERKTSVVGGSYDFIVACCMNTTTHFGIPLVLNQLKTEVYTEYQMIHIFRAITVAALNEHITAHHRACIVDIAKATLRSNSLELQCAALRTLATTKCSASNVFLQLTALVVMDKEILSTSQLGDCLACSKHMDAADDYLCPSIRGEVLKRISGRFMSWEHLRAFLPYMSTSYIGDEEIWLQVIKAAGSTGSTLNSGDRAALRAALCDSANFKLLDRIENL